MILISHRGNIDGVKKNLENTPERIQSAINLGYQVEIDIWYAEGFFFLGHDNPDFQIPIEWIKERSEYLWCHCKNIQCIEYLVKNNLDLNYFWHQEDSVTLTSKNYIWAYPGKQPIENSIAVLPEIHQDDVSKCIGICSDFIENYRR